MRSHVAVTSFAVWSSAGVALNASPRAPRPGGLLGAWPEAPPLSTLHPNARRPPRQAAVLVQLAHALLTARQAMVGGVSKEWVNTDVLLGTATGSEATDLDFLEGVQERGSGFGSPSAFVYTLATAAPAEVALALGLRGSLATVTAGSISGLTAVARAASHVAQGRSRAYITGGMEFPGKATADGREGELAALFLLEPVAAVGRWPTLTDASLGFDSEGSEPANAAPVSATGTMLALASACAEPRAGVAVEIAGHSPEGHWARFGVQW